MLITADLIAYYKAALDQVAGPGDLAQVRRWRKIIDGWVPGMECGPDDMVCIAMIDALCGDGVVTSVSATARAS